MKTMIQNNLLSPLRKIYSAQQSQDILATLMSSVDWQGDFVAFGRRFEIPRLQAWYADEGIRYRYSDNMLTTHAWVEPLLSIKRHVENESGYEFNSVLLTYYRNGDDHVSWHADDEAELGDTPVIASLSIGASREFHYRHNNQLEGGSIAIHSGSLLIMYPDFQKSWQHCIMPETGMVGPRINLTFRKVVATLNVQ